MIDPAVFSSFFNAAANEGLEDHLDNIQAALNEKFLHRKHGDFDRWWQAWVALPDSEPSSIDINNAVVRIGESNDLDTRQRESLAENLQQLHPWRKGPFELFGVAIDTEWRSDWKWDRVRPHLSDLKNRRILDVGCGNAYHCWRMAAEGARFVVGVDPSPKYLLQFMVLKKYLAELPVFYLPVCGEDLPANMQAFDTVFSMGVFYHRRSPFDHLLELKECLRPGGELVLETLVIEGNKGDVLVPDDRYAQMRNVWFIPSCETLTSWVKRSGFTNTRIVDVSVTSRAEQRSTDWMRFQSLADFLDPDNPGRTIEGYPAPRRATLIANNPAK
jgi:tRNA (mo5U34)-methyltransferase